MSQQSSRSTMLVLLLLGICTLFVYLALLQPSGSLWMGAVGRQLQRFGWDFFGSSLSIVPIFCSCFIYTLWSRSASAARHSGALLALFLAIGFGEVIWIPDATNVLFHLIHTSLLPYLGRGGLILICLLWSLTCISLWWPNSLPKLHSFLAPKTTTIHKFNLTHKAPTYYTRMSRHLSKTRTRQQHVGKAEEAQKKLLEQTLKDFHITGEIRGISIGPTVTTFEFRPQRGVKQAKIFACTDDIALALGVESVLILPLNSKQSLGIQVPNKRRQTVHLGELVASYNFAKTPEALPYFIGKESGGKPLIRDLRSLPHLLMAGATGAGKSIGMNSLISGLLVCHQPKDLRLLMIDPKMLELSLYDNIPHLLAPVITDASQATRAMNWLVNEMNRRYQVLQEAKVRQLSAYRKLHPESDMPAIVVFIDELADVLLAEHKAFEVPLQKLAQKARAAGIYLVIATQRPSVDVITGVIKANFPARVAYQVASRHDSRTILDEQGAEGLLGKGDLLFRYPGEQRSRRCQGCYVEDSEIQALVTSIKAEFQLIFNEDAMKFVFYPEESISKALHKLNLQENYT